MAKPAITDARLITSTGPVSLVAVEFNLFCVPASQPTPHLPSSHELNAANTSFAFDIPGLPVLEPVLVIVELFEIMLVEDMNPNCINDLNSVSCSLSIALNRSWTHCVHTTSFGIFCIIALYPSVPAILMYGPIAASVFGRQYSFPFPVLAPVLFVSLVQIAGRSKL